MSQADFQKVWNKATDTKVTVKGEAMKEWKVKMPAGKTSFNYNDIMHASQQIRLLVDKHRPGQYDMSVAVKHAQNGQWRGGKFLSTSEPNIYIWSPDDYDDLEDDEEDIPLDFQALDARIYIRRSYS